MCKMKISIFCCTSRQMLQIQVNQREQVEVTCFSWESLEMHRKFCKGNKREKSYVEEIGFNKTINVNGP